MKKRRGPKRDHVGIVPESISAQLAGTREQREVVGPLVAYLQRLGWALDEMIFGKGEWRVPKNPSAHTLRERGDPTEAFRSISRYLMNPQTAEIHET